MNFEEVQEILNSKKAIGYPKLFNIRQNLKYADILCNSFGGETGELTAITQYIYEHMELERYDGLSKVLFSIAKEEMMHLDMIGGLIRKLGRKPLYINEKQEMWSASNVKYNFMSLYDMLSYNIQTEKKTIEEYKKAIKLTKNKSIKELLERIILDEKTHIEIFDRLK